jgi:hypothetical protein
MYEDEDNDGKFPDESPVEDGYPRSKQEEQADRGTWPWLPGSIVEQYGPGEWYVCVEVRELAVPCDGRAGTARYAGRKPVLPATAAVVSYSHSYGLGRVHGQDGTAARLLPLSVDGLILAASLASSCCSLMCPRPWHRRGPP